MKELRKEIEEKRAELFALYEKFGNYTSEIKTTYIGDIVTAVCYHYEMSADEILKRTRLRKLVEPRQLMMYFAAMHSNLSLDEVGARLGGYNHSTVIHSIKKVRELRDTDKNYRYRMQRISKDLGYA